MGRFSRWASSRQALVVLAVLFGAGAVADAVFGHQGSALISGVLALAVLARAWPGRPRG